MPGTSGADDHDIQGATGTAGEAGTSGEAMGVDADAEFDSAFDEATTVVKVEDKRDAERDLSVLGTQGTAASPQGDEPGDTDFPDDNHPFKEEGTEGTSGTSGEEGTSGTVSAEDAWTVREREYQERIRILEAGTAGAVGTAGTASAASTSGTAAPVQPISDTAVIEAFIASLSEEDKQALELYDTEYEEVSKYEGLKRQAALKALDERHEQRLAESVQKLTAMFAPVLNVALEYGREKHEEAVKKVHGDYDALSASGDVEKWIKGRPPGLREQYQAWFDKGSTEQVITLINEFKASTGRTTAPPPGTGTKKTPTVVHVKRGPVIPVHRAGRDDFDGAFDEAVSKIGNPGM